MFDENWEMKNETQIQSKIRFKTIVSWFLSLTNSLFTLTQKLSTSKQETEGNPPRKEFNKLDWGHLKNLKLTLSWLHKSPKPYLALYLYEARELLVVAPSFPHSAPLSFSHFTALFLCAMRTRLQLPSCSNGCVSFSRAWQSKLGIRCC